MNKMFIFAVNNNQLIGYVDNKEEIPKEADTPVKEVEIHPAQIDWLNEVFSEFTLAQDFLQEILYDKEDPIKTVSLQ